MTIGISDFTELVEHVFGTRYRFQGNPGMIGNILVSGTGTGYWVPDTLFFNQCCTCEYVVQVRYRTVTIGV